MSSSPTFHARDDDAARVRIILDLVDGDPDLVDHAAVHSFPRAPLLAVYGAEIAVFIRPFVPDADPILLEVLGVGAALQKPQQFMDDGFQVAFLGSDQRETLCEVEAHLVAEDAGGAGAGAVGFFRSVIEDVLHQI